MKSRGTAGVGRSPWWLAALLLVPSVAFATPMDEGTEVEVTAGGGQYIVTSGGCGGPAWAHRVETRTGAVQAQHKFEEGLTVRATGQVWQEEVAERQKHTGCRDCDDPPGLEVGDTSIATAWSALVGFDVEHVGGELGLGLSTSDDGVRPGVRATLWAGMRDAHLYLDVGPMEQLMPNQLLGFGFGHHSERLRLRLGVGLGFLPESSLRKPTTGGPTAEAAVDVGAGLWLGLRGTYTDGEYGDDGQLHLTVGLEL